ncbi:hypothetical protein NLJ89_g11694 [Agrocybe chaxingu]|uniref:T4 RNA ligase 1-like N-terminal domain-containing protein n=1 Tax=Agrocybe chaxingu TaxID=84603 RepID=A0A9W8MRD8_9AGAR|nr:hypothetical protein NLJ89_g11694 [Agrocybe chaxingu]
MITDTSPLRSDTIDPHLLESYATTQVWEEGQNEYRKIITKHHPQLPISIHNYNDRALNRKQQWDDLVIASRTLVTETRTGKVVSRIFSKFFNFHEKLAYRPTGGEHAFAIEEKVDGSIISPFYYHDQWMLVSRASFDSPHIQSAWNILNSKYPGALRKLDQDKTYVFELIDPTMPIKVLYKTKDLVLLSIFSKSGQEPLHDFDWKTLPFSRPRLHVADQVNPKELKTLNLDNEEGFVVKFWRTADDRYPQRIKVKFDSYLSNMEQVPNVKSNDSVSLLRAPSKASILGHYSKHRLLIPHFNAAVVAKCMDGCKQQFLRGLEGIADDYGGDEWVRAIETIWDRIDALFVLQEDEWREIVERLQREGFRARGGAADVRNKALERRVLKGDVEKALRPALLSRFSGESSKRHVQLVVESMEFPSDLKSTEVIGIL